MADAAVALEGVTKRFGDTTAVDTVNLHISHGEFFSLLGPSGCGKTTILRMIAGLESPSRGDVWIFGQRMGLRPPHRRPVNTVFQSYALFPHMTVAQNVAFGLRMQKVPRGEISERVDRALGLVRLHGLEGRSPNQLSGGQQQRVALARALVNEPKVLLLDEPLGALDLKLRQAMQLELKSVQERVGITFIYVTHDQEEALTMSDRIGVMNEGRLLQTGTAEEIYESPQSRFVADFIGQSNFLAGEVRIPDRVVVGGAIDLRIADEAPVGSHATICIRPERLRLYPDDVAPESDLNNVVSGTVTRRVYVGTASYYEVDLGPASVRVRVENVQDGSRFAPGDTVVVVWEPEAAHVVRAD